MHSTADEEIWEWINQVETFAPGESSKEVAVPSTESDSLSISIGSYPNDKAIHLVSSEHPSLTLIPNKDDDGNYISIKLPMEGIFEGLWY